MGTAFMVVAGLAFLVFVALALVAVRRPLLARLAFREALRRPLQSAIVICGLMIGTGAILGPQVWQDSVTDSLAAAASRSWGRVDLTVSAGGAYFNPEVAGRIAADPAAQKWVSGVQAGVEEFGSVVDIDRGEGKPTVRLIGFDSTSQSPFGNYVLTDGRRTDGHDLAPGEVLISLSLAEAIEAHSGDRLRLSLARGPSGQSLEVRLRGVARPEGPGAYGLRPAVFMPLPTAQRLVGADLINVVRITARGEGQSEIDAARAAAPAVRAAAAAAGSASLEVRADKAIEADSYQKLNESNRPLWVALSLFVVAVGIALVINVALVLAEERRPRLALLRALGLSRGGLVALSVIEGGLYSLLAAVAGVLPAALVAWTMFSYSAAAEHGPLNGREIVFEPSLRPATVAIAIAAGALITAVILFFASIRTSRMAIASAIRQLPEPVKTQRPSWLRRMALVGLALAALPAALAPNPALRLLGGAALITVASALARGWLQERTRATIAGLVLTAWSLGMIAAVSGTGPAGGVNAYIAALQTVAVATLCAVFGLSIVVAANLRLVESLAALPGGLAAGLRVTLRPPLAYLARRPFRTGLAAGAFALVVAMEAMLTVVALNVQPDYEATSYDIVMSSSGKPDLALPASVQPLVDRQLSIATRPFLGQVRDIDSSGRVITDWRQLSIPLYELSDAALRDRLGRLYAGGWQRSSSEEDLWKQLRQDPTAVATSFAGAGDFIVLRGPTGEVRLKVVANFAFGFLDGIAGSQQALAAFAGLPTVTTVLVRTAPGADPDAVAREIRRSLVSEGVDVTTTRQLLAEGQMQGRAFATFFRLLMAMGMVVAVFSLGILALRAVVERRRAIGVLRALGYQRGQVLTGMLAEAAVSATLAVVVGMAVGTVAIQIVLSGLSGPPTSLGDEIASLLLIYAVVLVVTLAVTVGPALQASRLAPVEAMRVVG